MASSWLADTYGMLILHGYLPAMENWQYAINAANDAVQKGPNIAESYNSLAIISMIYDWNWKNAEIQFKKAISINPSFIQAYVWYGFFYQCYVKNNATEGIQLIQEAIKIDPLSGYTRIVLYGLFAQEGKYEAAIKGSKNILELDPTQNLSPITLSFAYLWSGNYKKAYEILEPSSTKSGNIWIYVLVLIYLKLNQKEKALLVYSSIEQQYNDQGILPTSFAIAAAACGYKKKL